MYNILEMKNIAKSMNNRTYTDYFYRLQMIARSRFEYTGLPDGVNEKWIERYLMHEGFCIAFKDPTRGLMITRATICGELNYYDEPRFLIPVATGYVGEPLEVGTECVLIQNNDLMLPTIPTLELFALRLSELSRTIDININAQKTPLMILCSDKQKLSLKKAYQQVNDYEQVIFADKNLDIDQVKVLKTDAPIVFPQLQVEKNAIWNECMTFLGIDNANMDKRERLITDEVKSNNGQIEMSAAMMLKSREFACKEINRLFHTNISVKMRDIVNEPMRAVEEEGDNND